MNSTLGEKQLKWLKLHKKTTTRNIIMQGGTELVDLGSFSNIPKFKIYIKKSNIEAKPVSFRKTCQRFKSSSPQSSTAKCIVFGSSPTICISMARSSTKSLACVKQNLFQNEALKYLRKDH